LSEKIDQIQTTVNVEATDYICYCNVLSWNLHKDCQLLSVSLTTISHSTLSVHNNHSCSGSLFQAGFLLHDGYSQNCCH